MNKLFIIIFCIFFNLNAFAINKVDMSKPIRIDADEISIDRNKSIMKFIGNVIIKQEQMSLNSNKMIVYYEIGINNKINVKNIKATDDVILKNENMIAFGDNANYDFVKQFITLNGNVKLNEKDAVVIGDKMTYDIKTEETKIFSNGQKNNDSNQKERVIIILDNIDNLKKRYDK